MAILRSLFGHYPLAGQRTGYEDGFAVTTGHATAIMAVVDDLGFKRGFIDAGAAGSCHVAVAACDCGDVLSQMSRFSFSRREKVARSDG